MTILRIVAVVVVSLWLACMVVVAHAAEPASRMGGACCAMGEANCAMGGVGCGRCGEHCACGLDPCLCVAAEADDIIVAVPKKPGPEGPLLDGLVKIEATVKMEKETEAKLAAAADAATGIKQLAILVGVACGALGLVIGYMVGQQRKA